VPMVDYYIDEILGGSGTLEEDRDKLREAVAFIMRIEDAVERNLFIKRVAERLNLDQEVLKAEVGRVLSHATALRVEPARRKTVREPDHLELDLIHMMLECPGRIPAAASGVLACFKTEELRSLGERVLMAAEKGSGTIPDVFSLVNGLEEGPVRARLLDLLMRESPYPDELIDRLMDDTIRKICERPNKERRKILTSQIKEAERVKDEGLEDLIVEKNRLLREE